MLKDLAFYGSASTVAMFLAFFALWLLEDLIRGKFRPRYGIRSLLFAMTLAAVLLGIFSMVVNR